MEPARSAEFKASTARHRMRLAAGLLAMLLIPVLVAGWLLTQPWVIPRTSAPPAVDVAALEAHVRALSEKFYPRSFDQLEKLDAAADYIKSEFLRSGAGVEEQVFAVEEAHYRNIIARYGPETGPVLVVRITTRSPTRKPENIPRRATVRRATPRAPMTMQAGWPRYWNSAGCLRIRLPGSGWNWSPTRWRNRRIFVPSRWAVPGMRVTSTRPIANSS